MNQPSKNNFEPGTQEWIDDELAFAVKFLNEKYKRLASQAGGSISDLYWRDKLDKSVDEAYNEILVRANAAKVARDGNKDGNLIDNTGRAKEKILHQAKPEGIAANSGCRGNMMKTGLDHGIEKATAAILLLDKVVAPVLAVWLWAKYGVLTALLFFVALYLLYKVLEAIAAAGLLCCVRSMEKDGNYLNGRILFLSLSMAYALCLLAMPWGLLYAVGGNASSKAIPACEHFYSNKGDRESISALIADYQATLPIVQEKDNVMMLSELDSIFKPENFVALEGWVCRAQKLYGRPLPPKSKK